MNKAIGKLVLVILILGKATCPPGDVNALALVPVDNRQNNANGVERTANVVGGATLVVISIPMLLITTVFRFVDQVVQIPRVMAGGRMTPILCYYPYIATMAVAGQGIGMVERGLASNQPNSRILAKQTATDIKNGLVILDENDKEAIEKYLEVIIEMVLINLAGKLEDKLIKDKAKLLAINNENSAKKYFEELVKLVKEWKVEEILWNACKGTGLNELVWWNGYFMKAFQERLYALFPISRLDINENSPWEVSEKDLVEYYKFMDSNVVLPSYTNLFFNKLKAGFYQDTVKGTRGKSLEGLKSQKISV